MKTIGGGTGWTGATTCVSGYTCSVQNQYYSQCIPGLPAASPTTAKPSSTPATTMKTTTKIGTTTALPPTGTATGALSKAVGDSFNIDGVTSYFAGTNSYWIGFLTNNADVDLVMSHLQTSGIKILRVWGFNDVTSTPGSGTVWYQSLVPGQSPVINTGANGLERLDYVVQSAAAHDVKLIINFVNNWSDYGGIPAYVTYYGLSGNQAWYTSAAAQKQYQAYIKAVVSRYSSSSAVFAWELANEPRCNGCSTDIIYTWAKTTSQYVKSLDSKHMVTIGDEGFGLPGDTSYPYTTAEGVSWVNNLNITTLDFATFHMYPDSWGVDATDWPTGWIQAHGNACVAANKPCFFEEYGYPSNHVAIEQPWQNTALAAPGIAGDAFWQLGDTISSGQTSNDGNTIYYGSSEWTSLVTDHVAAIAKSGKA